MPLSCWAAEPDIAIAGPNIGSTTANGQMTAWNQWTGVLESYSGQISAVKWAVGAGIPAIAFSGVSGEPTAYNNATSKPVAAAV